MVDGQQPGQDRRPRPQYGEYATPKDQADAIATSMPPVSPVLLPSYKAKSVPPPPDPATRMPDAAVSQRGAGTDTSPSSPGGGVPRSASRPRRWDQVLSVSLLVYGLLNVVSGLFQYADLGAYLDELFAMFGIGDYSETGMERGIGIAIVASNVVSYALVVWFTMKALRAGRIAFWIPLAGGLVVTIVSAVFLQILLSGNPALASYLEGLLRP